MQHYDYLVVGSGLFGATVAYRLTQAGKRVLVIDKRAHTGGNVHCEDVAGIRVHAYGAHIFHTNSKEVWDFVSQFVEMNRYTNCPVADYHGKRFNLPFNMNTFSQMWGVRTPEEAQAKIDEQRGEYTGEPHNLEEQAIRLVGRDIYEKLIKEYTEKQWGRPCNELPAFIIRRLPLRFVYDNNYFNDRYQGIPVGGYNVLIDKLLSDADVRLNTDFSTIRNHWRDYADKLIYTGCLDEYFNYRLGRLDWRTVRFENEVINTPNYQGNAVINYTSHEVPYTRVIEHKHFESFGEDVNANPQTVISREFSTEWQPGMEPYYPVNDERNNQLAEAYRLLATEEKDVIFGGRLAEYRYYDMAPAIERALHITL